MTVITTARDESIDAANLVAALGGIGVTVRHIKDTTFVEADTPEEVLKGAVDGVRGQPPGTADRVTFVLPQRRWRPWLVGAAAGVATTVVLEAGRWLIW